MYSSIQTGISFDEFYGSTFIVQTPIPNENAQNRDWDEPPALAQSLKRLQDQIDAVLESNRYFLDRTYYFESSPEPKESSLADRALFAISDLQMWLAIGQDQVAALADFAPRNVKNWREGTGPYPATVRQLFDLRALIGAIVEVKGVNQTRLWIHEPDLSGKSRYDSLSDKEGLLKVLNEARHLFFERSDVTPIHKMEFDDSLEIKPLGDSILGDHPVRRSRARRHPR